MRVYQFWWRNLVFYSQSNPPKFIAMVMLFLAIPLLLIWVIQEDWPYLVLCLTYLVGASALIWVSEVITPVARSRFTHVTILMLLAIGFLVLTVYLYSRPDLLIYL